MKTYKLGSALLVISTCMLTQYAAAFGAGFASLNDCLVTSNIGKYSYETQRARMGNGSGVISMAGHFNKDHTDTVCSAEYSNINEIRGLPIKEAEEKIIGVDIQVTQHPGSDSDKWLAHELEREFRNYYGLPGDSYVMRVVNGNAIMAAGSGGWDYRWLSGYKVIHIEYTDLQMTKPEPIEVVQAYLAKYPSTLSSITSSDLRTAANKIRWIKDEMDRRLWLCDKWFMQLQLQKVQQKDAFQAAVKSMNIFLDYREKYYGIKAANEKDLLASYLNTNNGTGIKAKLTEYKNWWTVNKDKAISL